MRQQIAVGLAEQGFLPNKELQRIATAQEKQAKSLEQIADAIINEEDARDVLELMILTNNFLENKNENVSPTSQADTVNTHDNS